MRELQGGTSSVAFSYRIVALRKDIKAHKRFARIDTRMPAAPAPRKAKPTAAALRTFVAGIEREARARAPAGARKRESSRGTATAPRLADLMAQRQRARKK